jgi:phage shock protein PspC (stress-responsive transcriptional regulator)
MQVNERLYRSVDDRVLAGVAGGLADRLGIDPALVRIVWALLGIFSGGIFVLIYIVMAIVVPEEDEALFPPVPPAAPGAPAVPGSPEVPGVAAAPGTASGWTQPAPTTGWVAPPPPAGDWRAQARAQRREARAARRAQQGPGQGGIVVGVVLILLGTWFLLRQYIPELDLDRLWPFALLILGVLLLAFSVTGRPGGSPGGSTTGSGEAQK